MATVNAVDKNDANALHLLAVLKATFSDVNKQDNNKTPNDKLTRIQIRCLETYLTTYTFT